jgi:hypothetical protein
MSPDHLRVVYPPQCSHWSGGIEVRKLGLKGSFGIHMGQERIDEWSHDVSELALLWLFGKRWMQRLVFVLWYMTEIAYRNVRWIMYASAPRIEVVCRVDLITGRKKVFGWDVGIAVDKAV